MKILFIGARMDEDEGCIICRGNLLPGKLFANYFCRDCYLTWIKVVPLPDGTLGPLPYSEYPDWVLSLYQPRNTRRKRDVKRRLRGQNLQITSYDENQEIIEKYMVRDE